MRLGTMSLSGIGNLKVDKQNAKATNNTIANYNRPKHQANTVHQPYNGASKYNQHHGHAQISYTFSLPDFVHLRYKRDAA